MNLKEKNPADENIAAKKPAGHENFPRRSLDFLRSSFRFALLLAGALISGCISSVEVAKRYTTWEPIGEETRTITIPPRIELLVNTTNPPYIEISVKKICETRTIKRAVTQALNHTEYETKKLGEQFLGAGAFLIGGGLLIADGTKKNNTAKKTPDTKDDKAGNSSIALGSVLLVITPIAAGYGIYTAISASIDKEEYGNGIRQKNKLLSVNPEDCTTNLPVVLKTSRGVFPLGMTDASGRLRVRLMDVIPPDVLANIVEETALITIGAL